MVPKKSVTRCQVCSSGFTFTVWRHHCKACGKVRVASLGMSSLWASVRRDFFVVCEGAGLLMW